VTKKAEHIKPAGLNFENANRAGYDFAVRAGDLVYISGQGRPQRAGRDGRHRRL
jgi:hypothetical protein